MNESDVDKIRQRMLDKIDPEEMAVVKKEIEEAVSAAGFDSFDDCVARFTTEGLSQTEIAKRLGVKPQDFWAYYGVYVLENAEPLRLGGDGGDG